MTYLQYAPALQHWPYSVTSETANNELIDQADNRIDKGVVNSG